MLWSGSWVKFLHWQIGKWRSGFENSSCDLSSLLQLIEINLCILITLLGCLAKPKCSFAYILGHSTTFRIHYPEVELSICVTLLGCLEVPAHSLVVVLIYSTTISIHLGDIKRLFGISWGANNL
ncbi:hypothetical protein CCP4SC76_1520001 [Gammaproteobacteria bacterium]